MKFWWGYPCSGLTSLPERSSRNLCRFTLRKPEYAPQRLLRDSIHLLPHKLPVRLFSILKILLVPFLREQSAVTRCTEWAKVKVQSRCSLDVFKTLQSTLRFWEKSKCFELSFNHKCLQATIF